MDTLASQTSSQQTGGEPRPQWLIWGLAGLALIALLVLGWFGWQSQTLDPYTAEVLSLQGDADRGGDIFLMNCATCHGFDAGGRVGPSLKAIGDRKSKRQLVEQVVSGKTPPMPQFQPSTQDMADLLSYLQTL